MSQSRFARLIPLLLVAGLVHLMLSLYGTAPSPVAPFNDVSLYGSWMQEMLQSGNVITQIPGISRPFVYPFVAIVPMLIAFVLGGADVWQNTLSGWLPMITVLNLAAIGVLTDWGKGAKSTFTAAWFWIAFLALLGPISLGRIDSIASALAVFGLVALFWGRFQAAMVLFTVGAWVKIWPIAMGLALLIAEKRKNLVFSAAAFTVSITIGVGLLIGLVLIGGGGSEILGFVFTQGNRGIQIESPIATFWIWFAKLGLFNASIYFDQGLLTNQIAGDGVELTSTLMSLAMIVAVAITALLGIRAFRAGADYHQIFTLVALTATLDLIVFNKVGSPQFEGWLAVPVMAGLIFGLPRWRVPVIGALLIAGLTNLVYPILYMDLMGLGWPSIVALTLRNALLIALLVWANLALQKLSDQRSNNLILN